MHNTLGVQHFQDDKRHLRHSYYGRCFLRAPKLWGQNFFFADALHCTYTGSARHPRWQTASSAMEFVAADNEWALTQRMCCERCYLDLMSTLQMRRCFNMSFLDLGIYKKMLDFILRKKSIAFWMGCNGSPFVFVYVLQISSVGRSTRWAGAFCPCPPWFELFLEPNWCCGHNPLLINHQTWHNICGGVHIIPQMNQTNAQ